MPLIVIKFQCGLKTDHPGPHNHEAVHCATDDRCRQLLIIPRTISQFDVVTTLTEEIRSLCSMPHASAKVL